MAGTIRESSPETQGRDSCVRVYDHITLPATDGSVRRSPSYWLLLHRILMWFGTNFCEGHFIGYHYLTLGVDYAEDISDSTTYFNQCYPALVLRQEDYRVARLRLYR